MNRSPNKIYSIFNILLGPALLGLLDCRAKKHEFSTAAETIVYQALINSSFLICFVINYRIPVQQDKNTLAETFPNRFISLLKSAPHILKNSRILSHPN